MFQQAKRPCPICHALQVEALHTQHFELVEGHPLSAGYDVVCCDQCGFVYADTSVSQADYDRFYAQLSKYGDRKTGTGGGDTPQDRQRLQDTTRQIADFLGNPTARVLDVGCANGGLLKALQDMGYSQVLGVDPSFVCVENTLRQGVDACVGSLFQPLNRGRFDCVVLSHTLEHVQQVGEALEWVDDVLADDPRGCVYIEVPDASHYADYVVAPFQDFNTEHINHFSLLSLSNLMQIAGYHCLLAGDKLLELGLGMQYPSIYGFWRKGAPVAGTPPIKKDFLLRQQVLRYITVSQGLQGEIYRRLSDAVARSPQVIVWGTGQLTMKLLVDSPLAQAEVVAFVDSNPVNQGHRLRGVPIIAPQDISPRSQPIIIASTIHQAAIVDQARRLGLTNELVVLRA